MLEAWHARHRALPCQTRLPSLCVKHRLPGSRSEAVHPGTHALHDAHSKHREAPALQGLVQAWGRALVRAGAHMRRCTTATKANCHAGCTGAGRDGAHQNQVWQQVTEEARHGPPPPACPAPPVQPPRAPGAPDPSTTAASEWVRWQSGAHAARQSCRCRSAGRQQCLCWPAAAAARLSGSACARSACCPCMRRAQRGARHPRCPLPPSRCGSGGARRRAKPTAVGRLWSRQRPRLCVHCIEAAVPGVAGNEPPP